MLVEANWLVNVPNFRDEGQQIVLFKFLSETKEIFLPVAIGTFRVQDPVMQVLNFLELYLENINKSVDSSKELWYSRMQGE